MVDRDRSSDKLQNAICYAIDGDHPEILDMLSQREQPELVGNLNQGLTLDISHKVIEY